MQRKAVVGPVLAHCPVNCAGHTVSVMNWILGLKALGWEIWLAEEMEAGELKPGDGRSLNESFFEEMKSRYEVEGTLLIDEEAPDRSEFEAFAREADLFINYSGQFRPGKWFGPSTRKVYLDVDPGFTQVWAVGYGVDMNFEGHTDFWTVGLNLNGPDARIPQTDRTWQPTVPPVAIRYWDAHPPKLAMEFSQKIHPPADRHWSTVAHWYGLGENQWEGVQYSGKRESFLSMIEAGRRASPPFVIATDLQPEWGEEYGQFVAAGWHFCPAEMVSADEEAYRSFIAGSRGELGIAKLGYVQSNGGWMSDRTVSYLAAGRPAILQETGWSKHLRVTEGLVPFTDPESCVAAQQAVERDYERHSRAARKLAEEVFNAEIVLNRLLEPIGLA